jgi:cyclase
VKFDPDFTAWPIGLHTVADGVYAYVQGNGPYGNAGFSNAGFVVGPEYVVVIDTLGTNSMHEGFIKAIRSVTALPVGLVIITHHHVDHVLGTHRFMPARVICHRQCRAHIAAGRDTMVQRWRSMRPLLAPDLDDIPVVVPDITFEQRISVHLGERELVVFHPGLAHTDGDAAVYLPQDRLLFTGDLFFNRVCPAAFQGSVSGWIAAVEGMLSLDAEVIVPGHGPVADRSALAEMLHYLRLIQTGSEHAHARGLTPQQAFAEMELGAFRDWFDTEHRLLQDIERVYASLQTQTERGCAA